MSETFDHVEATVRTAHFLRRLGVKSRGDLWEFLNDPDWKGIALSYQNVGQVTVRELEDLKNRPDFWRWDDPRDRRCWPLGNCPVSAALRESGQMPPACALDERIDNRIRAILAEQRMETT